MERLHRVLITVVVLFTIIVPIQGAVAEEEKGSWDKAGKEIGEAAEAVGEASKETWKATKEKSAEVADEAGEAGSKAWDKTKETSSKAWEKTKETTSDVIDEGKAKIHEMTAPDPEKPVQE